jgi:hypothetical protein
MKFPLGTPVLYSRTVNDPAPLAAVVVADTGLTYRVVIDCGPTRYATPYDRDTRVVWTEDLT